MITLTEQMCFLKIFMKVDEGLWEVTIELISGACNQTWEGCVGRVLWNDACICFILFNTQEVVMFFFNPFFPLSFLHFLLVHYERRLVQLHSYLFKCCVL